MNKNYIFRENSSSNPKKVIPYTVGQEIIANIIFSRSLAKPRKNNLFRIRRTIFPKNVYKFLFITFFSKSLQMSFENNVMKTNLFILFCRGNSLLF